MTTQVLSGIFRFAEKEMVRPSTRYSRHAICDRSVMLCGWEINQRACLAEANVYSFLVVILPTCVCVL